MVERYIVFEHADGIHITKKFIVFKLNFNMCKWKEETTLGGLARALCGREYFGGFEAFEIFRLSTESHILQP